MASVYSSVENRSTFIEAVARANEVQLGATHRVSLVVQSVYFKYHLFRSLLAATVTMRMEQRKIDNELQNLQKWKSASASDPFWVSRAAELEAAKTIKLAEAELMLQSLVETDYWPTYSQATLMKSENDYRELIRTAKTLQDVVNDLHGRIRVTSEGNRLSEKQKSLSEDPEDTDTVMIGPGDGSATLSGFSTQHRDLEKRLDEISTHLGSLENRMLQRDDNLTSDMEFLIEGAVEKFILGNPNLLSESERVVQQTSLDTTMLGRQLDGDIQLMMKTISELLARDETSKKQIFELQQQLQLYSQVCTDLGFPKGIS